MIIVYYREHALVDYLVLLDRLAVQYMASSLYFRVWYFFPTFDNKIMKILSSKLCNLVNVRGCKILFELVLLTSPPKP